MASDTARAAKSIDPVASTTTSMSCAAPMTFGWAVTTERPDAKAAATAAASWHSAGASYPASTIAARAWSMRRAASATTAMPGTCVRIWRAMARPITPAPTMATRTGRFSAARFWSALSTIIMRRPSQSSIDQNNFSSRRWLTRSLFSIFRRV